MYTVHYQSREGEATVRVGKVMFGTGRKPNTRGIGLEVRLAALVPGLAHPGVCPRSCSCHAWHACCRGQLRLVRGG